MGHALTAYRHLSRLKSTTISPDGNLGGHGYIMPVQDIRNKLHQVCETLSAITDTLYDEINAPHWKPRLAQLDDNEAEDVERFVEESKGNIDAPEDLAEESEQEIEEMNDGGRAKDNSSELPGSGVATPEHKDRQEKQGRVADSSVSPDSLSGPRVVHLGPGEDPNPQDAYTNDGWGTPSGRDYDYPSAWDNDLADRGAASKVPDYLSEPTETQAWDFGLGFGARGQGAGGYENPSGEGNNKGVWGPASGLPGASGDILAQGKLPGDDDHPVARSDYYRGDRGNLVNTQSVLPAVEPATGRADLDLVNVNYIYEDTATPYVRHDYSAHDYSAQRDDNDNG